MYKQSSQVEGACGAKARRSAFALGNGSLPTGLASQWRRRNVVACQLSPIKSYACACYAALYTRYGSQLVRLQEEQRAARKRSSAFAFGDGSLTARLASPRRRRSGPPSSRDKVWDLLRKDEKEQILRDEVTAAEGTKLLLERRASQLGCSIVEMPDEDDWEIGFRLTECKATSEPLAKPKTCSICLRYGARAAMCRAMPRARAQMRGTRARVCKTAEVARIAHHAVFAMKTLHEKSVGMAKRTLVSAAGMAWCSTGTPTTAAAARSCTVPSTARRRICRQKPLALQASLRNVAARAEGSLQLQC